MSRLAHLVLLLTALVAWPAAAQVGPDSCASDAVVDRTHETGPVLDRHRRAVSRLDADHRAVTACLDVRADMVARTEAATTTTTELRQGWVEGSGWHDQTRIDRTFDDAGRRTEEIVATRTVGDWENQRRTLSAYPGNDLILTFAVWADGDWLPTTRSSFFYRSDQRSTGTRAETWVAETAQWRIVDQTVVEYDAQGRQTAVTIESWDGTALTPVQQTLTDRDGTVTTVRFQTWTGSGWLDAARTTFTDAADGRPLSRLDEVRRGGGWANDARTLYTYDDPVEVLTQQWRSGTWSDAARTLIQMDGEVEIRTTETWNESAWIGLDQTEATRDGEGRLTQSVTRVWNGEAYVNSRRVRRDYTGAILTDEVYDRWDSPSDDWWFTSTTRVMLGSGGQPIETEMLSYSTTLQITSGTRTAYAYDAQGRLISLTREAYDKDTEVWTNDSRTLYIDNGPVARDADPPGRLALSVRPNPILGRGIVHVEAGGPVRVDVFDAIGRRVAVLADGVLGNPALRLPPLAPGLYVVRLSSGDGVITQSVTVAR